MIVQRFYKMLGSSLVYFSGRALGRTKKQLTVPPAEDHMQPQVERPISQKILKLKDFIDKKEKQDPKYLLENSPEKVFVFGVEPIRFRHQLFVYFKYSFWHTTKLGESKLQAFLAELQTRQQSNLALLKEDASSWSARQNLELIKQYRKHFVTVLFPSIISEMSICQKYIQVLIKFLEESERLDDMSIKHIFSNIQYILYSQNNNKEFINERNYGWMMITAFNLFISKLQFKELNWRHKSLMIVMGKTLRTNNLKLLEFIKNQLQNEKKQVSYYDFLAGLNLLSINKSFPYQYFYQNKQQLLQTMEAADNLSQKKVNNALIMLEIFSRQRLMYCEKIINGLLVVLEQNLLASDVRQLIRIFYYYSKLKSSIKHDFVIKIVERIYLFLDDVTGRDYGLIIKAMANLNYQNRDLVQKLKEMNYELFLTNLKYGCEKLGSFYQAILDEVQNSYKQDSLRYQRLDDQDIPEVRVIDLTPQKQTQVV